jgi:hypothetical protein
MEIKVNYEGKLRTVRLSESDRYPIDTVFDADIEGYGKMEIMLNNFGKWEDISRKNMLLAQIIMLEKERVEKTQRKGNSFDLLVDFHGKRYDLQINPIHTDTGDYYGVVHSGRFLFYAFPPAVDQHQWHAGRGNENQEEQKFAAVIGIAIENK